MSTVSFDTITAGEKPFRGNPTTGAVYVEVLGSAGGSTSFSPSGNTVNLAVTGTAQSLTLTAGQGTIRIANIGTQTVFIAFSGTASASTSIPLLPNTVETFAKGSVASLSAIAASTGSTLYVTTGVGE